jgi:putative aldouronate transport system substrate-binding protein
MRGFCTRVVVVALVALVPLTAAVAGGQQQSASDKVVPLKLYTVGDEPRDMDAVWAVLNTQLRDEIGVEIEPVVIPFSDRLQKYPILLASGEPFDLVFLAQWNFLSTITDGAYLPLDDLLPEYGPDLLQRIPDLGWRMGTYDGARYVVPKIQTELSTHGMIIREDLRVAYGAPEPTDYDSALEFLAAVKANEAEMIPYNAYPDDDLPVWFWQANDLLSAGISAIDDIVKITFSDFSTVVNVTETEAYRDYLSFVRTCYQNGYWSRSVLSNKISSRENFENNRSAALTWNPITAGQIAQKVESTIPGAEVAYYSYEGDTLVAQEGFKAGYAIYQASRYPEEALTFLNLMHTNEELYRLMWYGIENEHYVLTEDGKIDSPEGVSEGDVGYSATYMIHGMYDEKYHLQSVNEWPEVARINTELMTNAKENILLTFKPRTEPISAEIAAIAAVADEYATPLVWGVVDPDEGLSQLQNALKAAGIDKVIEELQSQLDAFNAARQ